MKVIHQAVLKTALDRMEPWRHPDYRKLPNGRIVRFVDWKRLASRKRA